MFKCEFRERQIDIEFGDRGKLQLCGLHGLADKCNNVPSKCRKL